MPKHVRTGDQVIVTQGSDKGKTGEIIRVYPKEDRVIVRGIAMRTKHLKPTQKNPQGGIYTKESAIHISNVSPVVDGKPTRVRFETKDDGSKIRVAARGGKELGVVRGPRK
ncbi:LSU ribosomal protein L24p (L26e) [hydrothermal vent metagenome]|uniref:LSU ribosomal protein L24p (L26e) n=1 Tax=hydrothermal vent metagenome TaxID=652676 RepID=A0A3B1DEP4_9ZZZZ